MTRPPHLLILGLGYSARAVAAAALRAGFAVTATRRDPAAPGVEGAEIVPPAEAADALVEATHWLAGAPPGEAGDPFLQLLGNRMAQTRPEWIGYFSTTGLYGDRKGGWVDERSVPDPKTERGRRRLAAETAWIELAGRTGARIDLLRLAGIYGPGRSAFDALRAGTSRRIVAPGHAFGRIHRDDIAGATLAAMRAGPTRRVCNLVDDQPAESAEVIAHAALLLGMDAPPAIPLADALPGMSPMGRSFWAENRKVSGRATQDALGRTWLYPTFREGLAAIFMEEAAASHARDGA